jgi:hypothetical protein
MVFLLADRLGLVTKAWRTFSISSGVLSEGTLFGGFLFTTDDVSLKFLTHNSTVLQLGTLSFWWILKCRRNILSLRQNRCFFKIIFTSKTPCSTEQRSMATEMVLISLEGRSRPYSLTQIVGTNATCLKASIGNKTNCFPTFSISLYLQNHLQVPTRFNANYCIILDVILTHSHSQYPVLYAHVTIFFTVFPLLHFW